MQRINYPQPTEWDEVLKRPTQTVTDIEEIVNSIFKEVQADGDAVIKKYTTQFDKVTLESLLVTDDEVEKASLAVSDALKQAINLAKSNIDVGHSGKIGWLPRNCAL